jgi:hypothetical protein
VYQLGDLFDRRKYINFYSLDSCKKYFFDKLEENNITLHTLVGNHDIYWRESLEVNSTSLVLGEYNNIQIHSSPTTVHTGDTSIDVIPWICAENQEQIGEFIKNSKSDICIGHFEIAGFAMHRGMESHDGLAKETFEKFDLEKAKRRFINSLIQGASKKGHYMFSLVEEELNRIDPRLLNLYGVLMSINDLLYWIMPEQMMNMMGETGQGVEGTEDVDDKTDPPTIKVKGLFFPILIHELLKGVYEVLGTQGLPDDPKAAEMVMMSQDTLPYEMWDLRLGPVIWERFLESYPDELFEDDLKEIQNYLFSRFSAFSTEEFFQVAREIMGKTSAGKQIVKRMVSEIIEELKKYDYEDAISSNDEDEEDDDDFRNFLGGLGIDLS